MLGFFLSSPLPARRAPTEPARGVEPLLALSLSTVTMSAACVNGEGFPFDWGETPGFRHAPRPALYRICFSHRILSAVLCVTRPLTCPWVFQSTNFDRDTGVQPHAL